MSDRHSTLPDQPSTQPSLHTNPTVTIRLSDSTIQPSEDCAIEDSPIEPSTCEEDTAADVTDQEEPHIAAQGMQDLPENKNTEAHILEAEVKLFQRMHRMSTISMPSIAEERDAAPEARSIRSRSDSSSTLSSAGSNHVDWEELDKSEEAAPRDGGSDEVFRLTLGSTFANSG